MKYKQWSLSDKLSILQEAEENGAIETCRKHSLSTGTFTHGRRNSIPKENQD